MATVENKVIAAVSANLATLAAGWVATRYGLEIPAEVTGAVSVLATAVAGYFVKHTPRADEVVSAAVDMLVESGKAASVTPSSPASPAAVPAAPEDAGEGAEPSVPEPLAGFPVEEADPEGDTVTVHAPATP